MMKLYHAHLFPMDAPEIPDGWLEIDRGRITAMGEGLPPVSPEDLDLQGAQVLPGFIDAHTHLGIIEDDICFEGDDCNEHTDPFTPHLRAIDGINPMDRCFEEAHQRGITTVLSAPGSANVCGGSIAAIKTAGVCVDELLLCEPGIKFALGENPKSVYSEQEDAPATRMATAAILREGLLTAKRYLEDLDAYEADREACSRPELDFKSEALLPLLRGDQLAFFHCHRADDLFTALRISREFQLKPVLIHATEGYLAASQLSASHVPVILGPLLCNRCKPELKGAIPENAARLHEAGVRLAICTDHPELPIQLLPLSALTAVKHGLPREAALRAITLEAAEIAGISARVGSLTPGKDADLQIYPPHEDPLSLEAEPAAVMISGVWIKHPSENTSV